MRSAAGHKFKIVQPASTLTVDMTLRQAVPALAEGGQAEADGSAPVRVSKLESRIARPAGDIGAGGERAGGASRRGAAAAHPLPRLQAHQAAYGLLGKPSLAPFAAGAAPDVQKQQRNSMVDQKRTLFGPVQSNIATVS